jgi:hypothetical protein
VAAQPLQAEDPAEDDTVSPPLPLLMKPQADIRRQTLEDWQAEHSGSAFPSTRYSKSWPQSSQ